MTQVAEAEVPMAGNVKDIVNRLSRDMTNRVPFSVHTQNERRERQLFVGTFAYTSQQDDELSFNVGDLIELIEEVEDGWSRGRLKSTGAIGMFPTNFVAVKTAIRPKIETSSVVMRDEPKAIERTPSTVMTEILKPVEPKFSAQASTAESKTKEMARVKFVYNPQHPDELSLSELDVLINVVNKDCGDAGWFEGELAGKKGLFPDNFVELVQVPLSTESGVKFASLNNRIGSTATGSVHHPHHFKPPPVNPPQPAVPPKPLKMKVDAAAATTSSATPVTPTPISPTTSSANNSANAASSKKDAFAALRDKITSNLKVVAPSPLHTPTTKSSTFDSEDVDGGAGAEPTLDTNSSGDQVSELQHITKSRARPQKNRPMSMVMNRNKSTDESPIGARLSSPTANTQAMSTSMFTTTTSTVVPKEVAPLLSKITPIPQQPILPPSSASKPALRPVLAVEETRQDSGDYVSRAEYDILLERVKTLELRLSAVENRKF